MYMQKKQYNIYSIDSRNASSKAKKDVALLLANEGFEKLYKPSKYRIIRIVQQFFSILSLKKNTVLFIQYQSNILFFYKLLSKTKNCKKIAIIHDVESLRGNVTVEAEINLLNGFDTIISHNQKMTNYLIENGVRKSIYNLDVFDYLIDSNMPISSNWEKTQIFFAGNLEKSIFIKKLYKIQTIKFNLYGSRFEGLDDLCLQENIKYYGSFPAEELISHIDGGWGLVWDGDSLDTCTGTVGRYMRYNNPHKVSLCIISERPVIIWREAAMANYIQKKGLGICVDRLTDLPDVINKITEVEYNQILNNVKIEKKRLANGESLKTVLSLIND